MNEFAGRTALVTGGSRGLGEAFCRLLAAEGCRVIVNYAHGAGAAEAVAREIHGRAVQCDISNERDVQEMFREIGPVSILVSNARIDPYMRSAEMSDGEWWDAVMNVNLKGAYLCGSRECLDRAEKNKGLQRSLGTAVPAEIFERLRKEMEELGK